MKLKIAAGGLKFGTWNHRVIAYVGSSEPEYIRVHEVHYDEKGFAVLWDAEGAHVGGEGLTGLKDTIKRVERALLSPVLMIKALSDGHEVLVERDSGERATGMPVSGLTKSNRNKLVEMKKIITQEVRKRK